MMKKMLNAARRFGNWRKGPPLVRPTPLAASWQPSRHPTTSATLSFHSSSHERYAAKRVSPPRKHTPGKHTFIPQKAAVNLTDTARKFFLELLQHPPRPEIIGVMLNYHQSKQGDIRMVFSFDFVTARDIGDKDEPVSLEVLEDGVTPKPFADAMNDGLPKLYVNSDAFLKVLGATVDIDLKELTPVLYDREGNVMDPNA